MKILPIVLSSAVIWSSHSLSAANLMLDFGNPASNATVASPYLTLSPGHAAGAIPATHTSWNTIINSNDRDDLDFADGTTATGVTLVLGQEDTEVSGTINYATNITVTNLSGTGGGTTGRKNLLGTGSIYGDNSSSTAAGRDGFFGGGTEGAGSAIGFRVDGLTAGDYRIYIMGRNTNSNNTGSRAMTVHATTGASSGAFNFSAVSSEVQANTSYSTAEYTNQFNSFVEGENHVVFDFTLAEGQSLFVAVDGTGIEKRGFMNMAQIVAIPEPAAALLGSLGMLALLRRHRD